MRKDVLCVTRLMCTVTLSGTHSAGGDTTQNKGKKKRMVEVAKDEGLYRQYHYKGMMKKREENICRAAAIVVQYSRCSLSSMLTLHVLHDTPGHGLACNIRTQRSTKTSLDVTYLCNTPLLLHR
jgi:hypothetical protein